MYKKEKKRGGSVQEEAKTGVGVRVEKGIK